MFRPRGGWKRRVHRPDVTLDRFFLVETGADVDVERLSDASVNRRVYDPATLVADRGTLQEIEERLRGQIQGMEPSRPVWHAVATLTNGARFVVTPGLPSRGAFTHPNDPEWTPFPENAASDVATRLAESVDVRDPLLRRAGQAVFASLHEEVAERLDSSGDLFRVVLPDLEATQTRSDVWADRVALGGSPMATRPVELERAVLGMGSLDAATGAVRLESAYDPRLLHGWSSTSAQLALYAPMWRAQHQLSGPPPSPGRGEDVVVGFGVSDGSVLMVSAGAEPRGVVQTPGREGWWNHPVPEPTAERLARGVRAHFSERDVDLAALREAMTPTVREAWREMELGARRPRRAPQPSPLDEFTGLAHEAKLRGARDYRALVRARLGHYAVALGPLEGGMGLGPLLLDGYRAVANSAPVSTGGVVTHAVATVAIPVAATGALMAGDLRARSGLRRQLRTGKILGIGASDRRQLPPGR